jgi:serine protease SohB
VVEFFTEYGMFLAKAVTFVVAFLFVVAGIANVAGRNRQMDDDGTLRVKHLNDEMKALREGLGDEVMAPAARKAARKAREKAEKAEHKKQKKGADEPRKRVFVLDFHGDIRASAVEDMRREISAVLQIASKEDEVVVRLESPGGLVHSYGLAASQLRRVRDHGIPLTICVDEVAASGGYMMACIGDRIIAAPFAVIGSIGVVAQVPNVHRLLKKHDVDVDVMTAGEYKRTLTVFGENTDKGRQKFQEELEDTHLLFKEFVGEQRAGLDVAKVATGEHWFGQRALELGLVDELKTSDEYLLERIESADVFEVRWEHKRKLAERLGFSVEGGVQRAVEKLLHQGASRWLQ